MDRPRRARKPVVKFEATLKPSRVNWNVQDKQKLLAAIKKYGQDDIENLTKALKHHKSSKEIKIFLDTLRNRLRDSTKKVPSPKETNKEAPIEAWLRLATDLTAHNADYSDVTADVLSICGDLEPHMPSRNAHEVNYHHVYRYLARLLRGEKELPKMNQISAAVLLDVLQGLADRLGMLELSSQRHIMDQKYRLLKGRVSINNLEHHEATRRALENDIELGGVLMMGEKAPYPHNPQNYVHLPASKNARWNTVARKGDSKLRPPLSIGASFSPSNSLTQNWSPDATFPAFPTPSFSAPGSCLNSPTPSTSGTDCTASLASLASSACTASGIPPVPATVAPPKDALHGPKLVPQQLHLKLPPGIQVSPGSYRLTAESLKLLMQGLQQFPTPPTLLPSVAQPVAQSVDTIASTPKSPRPSATQPMAQSAVTVASTPPTPLPSAVQPMAQSVVTVASATTPGLQSAISAKVVQQSSVQAMQSGLQTNSAVGSSGGTELVAVTAPHVAQTNTVVNMQSDFGQQSATNPSLGNDAMLETGAKEIQPISSVSADGPAEMAILDEVVSKGTKHPNTNSSTILPKRTKLFSLNPLCIPVKYLKPARKDQSGAGRQ